MKKVFLYIMFVAVGLGLQSCLHDDDEVFEKSAAERIDGVLNETIQTLEGAQYGWAFNYYMGVDYAYGSFTMTAQFKNGKVTLKQQGYTDVNDIYVAVTSTYKMTRDQGPVLSFDTYNDILHYYGDPAGATAPTDVTGYEADFEFVVMGISEDSNTIYLKGKKFGNYMTLQRLEKPSDEYLAGVDYVTENMSSYAAMKYNDGAITAKFMYGDNYTISYIDENGEKETLTVPYTFTDEGVLFNQPITIGDNVISGIHYVDGAETLPLIDTEGQSITVSYDAVDVFPAGNWYIAASNLGEVAAAGFKSFTDMCKSNEGEDVDYAYIGTYGSGGYGFCFMSGGRYRGLEVFDFETEGTDTITFSFGGSVDNGGWYRNYDNLADATQPFYTTFKLTSDDAKNPSYFILTDVNNPDNVIKLVKDVVTYPAYK